MESPSCSIFQSSLVFLCTTICVDLQTMSQGLKLYSVQSVYGTAFIIALTDGCSIIVCLSRGILLRASASTFVFPDL